MRPEVLLLKPFLQKETYDTYRQYLDTSKEEQEIRQLYNQLDKAHEIYQRDLSFNEFYVHVLSNIVGNQHTIKPILDKLEKYEVGHDITKQLLTQYQERAIALTIATKAIAVSEGKGTLSDLASEFLEQTQVSTGDTSLSEFVSDNLTELYSDSIARHGLRWRLQSLNRIFGSLRRGNFGFIFARPESGKTTFLASEATYFASQIPGEAGPGLWFNNEEDGKQVQLRIFQAALGLDRFTLLSNIEQNNVEYHKIINNKLKIIDNASTHRRDVERICKLYNPSFIIFDQIDKIKGFDGDREDLKLGATYQWARELAKTYCPVIGVTQADGSGEGKKWLTMENVANAKTAKQAEADWILGIGASHQEGFEYVRHLHASKNKLPGDEDSDPKMRHGKVDCIIDPEIARYRDYD